MRITISLPEPLLENAKREAEDRGVTLSRVIGDALRFRHSGKRAPEELPFQLKTVCGKPLKPAVRLESKGIRFA